MEGLRRYVIGMMLVIGSFIVFAVYAEYVDKRLSPLVNYLLERTDFIGVIAIITTIVIYADDQKRQLKSRIDEERKANRGRKELSRTVLINELTRNKDVLENYERMEYQLVLYCSLSTRREIDYVNVHLDTCGHLSLLQSGLFMYFDENIQGTLSQLYSRIDLNNSYLKYRGELLDQFLLFGPDDRTKWRGRQEVLDLFLTKNQTDILDLSDDLERKLQQFALQI